MFSGVRRHYGCFFGEQLLNSKRQQKQREQLSQQTVIDKLCTVRSDNRAEYAAQRQFPYKLFIDELILKVKYQREKRYRKEKKEDLLPGRLFEPFPRRASARPQV